MKIRLFVPLLVILVMGLATSAFAQTSCNVASTPVSRATASGHTEQAGDIIFNCSAVGASATTAATITVSYGGVVITNDATYPAGRPIAITSSTMAAAPTVSNATISNTTGQVVINVPVQPAGSAAGSFSLTGVLVSLAGTGFTTLDATVSVSPGNGVLITAGQNVAKVITSVQAGLDTAGLLTGSTSALYFGTSTIAALSPVPTRGTFTAVVTEKYIDMYRESAQFAGAVNDTEVSFAFLGIPTGGSLTGCSASLNNASTGAATALVTLVTSTGVATTAVTAASSTVFARINPAELANLSAIEQMRISCTGFTITVATTPQPLTTPITLTVSLAPTGTALSGTNTVLGALATGLNQIPRYASSTISVGTVLAFTPNTTTMIFPYVTADPSTTSPSGTFDTGVVIANTTGETVGGTGIFTSGGSQAQAGTITFYFFPSSGTAADRFAITTASVASGASFIDNMSAVLRTGGRTAAFTGYVIAVANFTNAHGMGFVYGGSAASRITTIVDGLTIAPPVISGRSTFAAVSGVGLEVTSK